MLEHIASQNQAVLEAVGDMPQKVARLPACSRMKQDIKVVKDAVMSLSHQMDDHKHRMARLEAA